MSQKNGHDPQKLQQQQNEAQKELTTQQTASQTSDLKLEDKDFAEFIGGHDVDRDPEYLPDDKQADLEQLLSAEFGRHVVFGNIDKAEWESEKIMDHARALAVKSEFPNQHGPGSKCSTEDKRIMTGESDPNEPLTPDEARQISASFEERTAARSLSIGGRAFRGMTEVISQNLSQGDSGGSSSMLSKLTMGVFGS